MERNAGFRGQLATKSRRYSISLLATSDRLAATTPAALSTAHRLPDGLADLDQDLDETTLVVGSWMVWSG